MASENPETPLLVGTGERQFRTSKLPGIPKTRTAPIFTSAFDCAGGSEFHGFYNCVHRSNRARIVPKKQGVLPPPASGAKLEKSILSQNNVIQ